MSRKGGYQVLDFKGLKLSKEEVTIPGIYEKIKGNYGKRFVVSGLVFENNILPDMTVEVNVADTATFTVYGYTVSITNADVVTAASAAV